MEKVMIWASGTFSANTAATGIRKMIERNGVR